MTAQLITTPAGDRLVVLPEAEYESLLDAVDDADDRKTVAEYQRKIAVGEEELVSSAMVDRMLAGESRIKVWREHRGFTAAALAREAGFAQSFLSQIETGKRDGTVETLRKIAAILRVTLDDLVG